MSVRVPTPSTRRAILAGLDPMIVLKLLDDGIATPSPYEELYQELRDAYLQQGGPQTVSIAALVKEIDDCLIEDAYKRAGFVCGFEVCRHLLLGEIDLDALTTDDDDTPEGGAQ